MKCNWSSTRKTKKKFLGGLILQDVTPWNHKNMINCYFGGYFEGLGTNVEFNGFLWFCEFLKVSASIFWLETVLSLNQVFSLVLNMFQGVSSEETFYVQVTIVPGDIVAKEPRKIFCKFHIKIFFSMLNCEFFIAMSIYGSKLL